MKLTTAILFSLFCFVSYAQTDSLQMKSIEKDYEQVIEQMKTEQSVYQLYSQDSMELAIQMQLIQSKLLERRNKLVELDKIRTELYNTYQALLKPKDPTPQKE